MSKVLKKSQAIAILKASKSKPKALWNTDNNDKIVPLFTGGELIRTDVLGFHSVEKETPIDVIKAQISPALLGEKEIEEEKAEKATEEEKEQFRRSEIRAELEAKYSVQISELEAKIESVRVAAQSDGHIAGHQEGYEAGMNEGKDEGLKQGTKNFQPTLSWQKS